MMEPTDIAYMHRAVTRSSNLT